MVWRFSTDLAISDISFAVESSIEDRRTTVIFQEELYAPIKWRYPELLTLRFVFGVASRFGTPIVELQMVDCLSSPGRTQRGEIQIMADNS
jgi:hypothetical protein